MFKSDKKVFSFRKYKGYGLASAVIAAFFFASSVSADVVNNGDGTTTLSNDKASTVVDTAKFKDNTDKTATEIFNEGGYEAEAVTTGTDAVASEVSTKFHMKQKTVQKSIMMFRKRALSLKMSITSSLASPVKNMSVQMRHQQSIKILERKIKLNMMVRSMSMSVQKRLRVNRQG